LQSSLDVNIVEKCNIADFKRRTLVSNSPKVPVFYVMEAGTATPEDVAILAAHLQLTCAAPILANPILLETSKRPALWDNEPFASVLLH
jgi:hypothetical protein